MVKNSAAKCLKVLRASIITRYLNEKWYLLAFPYVLRSSGNGNKSLRDGEEKSQSAFEAYLKFKQVSPKSWNKQRSVDTQTETLPQEAHAWYFEEKLKYSEVGRMGPTVWANTLARCVKP